MRQLQWTLVLSSSIWELNLGWFELDRQVCAVGGEGLESGEVVEAVVGKWKSEAEVL